MNLDIEAPRYMELLTELGQRISSGEEIDTVPFELFSLHVEVTSRAADLTGEFLGQLQESVRQLQDVQAKLVDRLSEVVDVLNRNTKRLDEQGNFSHGIN
jgi:hypothetical protein